MYNIFHSDKLYISTHFSLVMVNLVVAIIVSDIEELKKEGKIQDTLNKASHIISHGNICFLSNPLRQVEAPGTEKWKDSGIDICVHSICFKCNGVKVSPNVRDKLLNIAKEKNNVQYKYGASSA